MAQLLPHAIAAAGHAQAHQAESAATSTLLNRAGAYLRARGWLASAGVLSERALAINEAHQHGDPSITAMGLHNLANILRDKAT